MSAPWRVLSKKVTTPVRLERKQRIGDTECELQAIIEHRGPVTTSGHYVCRIPTPADT